MSYISIIFLATVLGLSGCSSIKKLDIFTMEVERTPLDLDKPTIQQLEELKGMINKYNRIQTTIFIVIFSFIIITII